MNLRLSLVAATTTFLFAGAAFAVGGSSGPHVTYPTSGKIGAVIMNPYKIAPLTAVIRNGGYVLTDITVRIVPKEGGQEIKYKVSDAQARTHGGIPVFGLYGGYRNTVEVSYTRTLSGKSEPVKETYKIYAQPVSLQQAGYAGVTDSFFKAEVKKVDPEFKDRLILVNNMIAAPADSTRAVWNNPMGGALEWNRYPQNAIIDTTGEIRWYMDPATIYDFNDIYKAGIMMGFRQNKDGAFTWGYGQRYVKYDLMGREIWNHRLPDGYNDFSHAMDPMQNGNYLVRVASSDYKRPDGKHVRTVRDVIIEVDENGVVVDEWRLFDILDPYRDVVLKVLDQGAVCLNIDASKAGQTLSAEELAKQDASDHFGDIVGSGAGRNWVHVNSVDYDPTDDSIIISSRHQSALIKIGRDKEVKWIMGSPEGWKAEFKDKILTPIDKDGNPIKCEGSKCEGGFDWTWTQHTGWRIDSKSDKNIFYLSVFDNGDARGMEQPALPEMKYSRAVIYKIDQKKMTVEQIWQYGEERGHDWYSPVTSLTEYQDDKDSVFVYSATAGASYNFKTGAFESAPNPYIDEFKWGATEPSLEIQLKNTSGYQAMPIDLNKAFNAK
ncbi:aryl-sulfate sulfotransferase [Sutterella megalosphaeroides]|uniref:Arylsulfatase n=1 Tax=Sutterella megalosphaeroides TaxID=2494234 RepID=A0A2Z6ICL4_9BURK|nr:aryl-sulfate sulfotransferase [Sutterella megalosphaeroides]BBF24042.1 arylsulfatase [Sutterella megalosphaeroides]